MIKARSLAVCTLLAGALAFPAIAHAADQTGEAGTVRLEVLSPSAEAYVQYHGRVFVTSGKRTLEYRWGGTSCGSKVITNEMVTGLAEVATGSSKIAPIYSSGAGSNKCLVGYSIVPGKGN